jgi:hypothetical protein
MKVTDWQYCVNTAVCIRTRKITVIFSRPDRRISSFNPALLDREADPVTISCGCIRVGDVSTGSRIVRGTGNGSMR